MVLTVPWSDFAEEVKGRLGPSTKVYLSHRDGSTEATAGDPRLGLVVRSVTRQPFVDATEFLHNAELTVLNGVWTLANPDEGADLAIAAVAYVANDESPGLWVEAFPFVPDVSDVVIRMMGEFKREGALVGVTAEQFHDLAKPNIVILDRHEIQALIHAFDRETKSTPEPEEPSEEPADD